MSGNGIVSGLTKIGECLQGIFQERQKRQLESGRFSGQYQHMISLLDQGKIHGSSSDGVVIHGTPIEKGIVISGGQDTAENTRISLPEGYEAGGEDTPKL